MPLVRGLRTLNAIASGNTSSACLETLLSCDPGRFSDFSSVMPFPGQVCVLVNSNTAMSAIACSNAAMCAMFSFPQAANTAFTAPVSYCALTRNSCLFTFFSGYSPAANNAYAAFTSNPCAVTYSFTNSNANSTYTNVISTTPQIVGNSALLYCGLITYFPRLANNLICNVTFNTTSYCFVTTRVWNYPASTFNGNCCISSVSSPCYTFGQICTASNCCTQFFFTPLCHTNSGVSGNNIIYWGPNAWCDQCCTRNCCFPTLANVCVYYSTNCGQSWTLGGTFYHGKCNCICNITCVVPTPLQICGHNPCYINRYVDNGFFHLPLISCCAGLCCNLFHLVSGCLNSTGTCFVMAPTRQYLMYCGMCYAAICCNLFVGTFGNTICFTYFIPQTCTYCGCSLTFAGGPPSFAIKCGTCIHMLQCSIVSGGSCTTAFACFNTATCTWTHTQATCLISISGATTSLTSSTIGTALPGTNTFIYITNQCPSNQVATTPIFVFNNSLCAYSAFNVSVPMPINCIIPANNFVVGLNFYTLAPCCCGGPSCCAVYSLDCGCTWFLSANVALGNCFFATSWGTVGCNLVYVFGCNFSNNCLVYAYTGDGINWNQRCVAPNYGCLVLADTSVPKPTFVYTQNCLIGTIF